MSDCVSVRCTCHGLEAWCHKLGCNVTGCNNSLYLQISLCYDSETICNKTDMTEEQKRVDMHRKLYLQLYLLLFGGSRGRGTRVARQVAAQGC